MINIVFKRIRIKGFRSIKNELEFQLEREPGLYFISGKNLYEPYLGSNGSGKSSIWDAISWVNFGKTVDGTKGDDVITWDLDPNTCEVTEYLTKDGIDTIITRTQNPNLLKIQIGDDSAKVIDQAALDAFLNLDYDRFINCLIIGQFNATFLEYQPSEKLKMFSGIMPLEFWEQCSKIATKSSDTFSTNINILAERQRGLRDKQADQKARREDLDANQRGWEGTRQDKILELTKRVNGLHTEINKIELQQKEQEAALTEAGEKRVPLNFDLSVLQSNTKTMIDQKSIWQDTQNRDLTKKELLKEELNKWKSLAGKCPTCGQVLPNADDSASHIKRVTRELVLLNRLLKDSNTKITDFYNKLQENQNKIEKILEEDSSLFETIKELGGSIIGLANNKQLKLQEIRQLRSLIDSCVAGSNPYAGLLLALDKEIETTSLDLVSVTKELEEANKNLNGAEYWVKGFKELRMWVVSDALNALEIESNNALSKLGLVNWKMKLQMERETQKGGISRGFHVLVHSKNFTKNKYLPLKIWSGGEARRLKLAGVIGFASLIQNYTGVNFNISVWDEPSSYLSSEGITDLIEFLSEQAEANKKVIYFTDQRNLEASNFKSVITVEKDESGTHLINE